MTLKHLIQLFRQNPRQSNLPWQIAVIRAPYTILGDALDAIGIVYAAQPTDLPRRT
jgi:hypothetical protein